MPALIDARPPGVDVLYKPGDPKALEHTFPAGYLDGRTFVATLDAASLAVDVTGDVLTVSATAAQTMAAGASQHNTFTLTEVMAGDDVTTIVGTWSASVEPAASQTSSVTVVVDDNTVNVSVLANPAVGPSNLIDEAVLTTPTADLVVNAFVGALVPNSIVTVPDVPYSTLLRGHGSMIHNVANSMCGLVIVTEGGLITDRVDTGYGYTGTPATNPATGYPEVLVDPNSPGNYQLMVFSFVGGTVRVEASAAQKAWLRVFSA